MRAVSPTYSEHPEVINGNALINGVSIRYRTIRREESTQLPSLVMLHQSPLSSRRFIRLLPHLADFCTPYALDSPGYGESQSLGAHWTVEEYARIVIDFAGSLPSETSFLFGRATGSVFAAHAASRPSQPFRGVILHGLPVYTDEEKKDRLASFAPPYVVDDAGGHLGWIWDRIHSEYPWIGAELATSLVADYLDAGPDFASAYRSIWQTDLKSAARSLTIPVLLLGGERDRLKFMFARACQLLPQAKSILIPEATDFVAEQEPLVFSSILRDFIGSL